MRPYSLLPVLVAVLLAGCGPDDSDRNTAPVAAPPGNVQPPQPSSADPMDPDRATNSTPAEDKGSGLGTEFGTDSGEVTDPATGEGTGTTQ